MSVQMWLEIPLTFCQLYYLSYLKNPWNVFTLWTSTIQCGLLLPGHACQARKDLVSVLVFNGLTYPPSILQKLDPNNETNHHEQYMKTVWICQTDNKGGQGTMWTECGPLCCSRAQWVVNPACFLTGNGPEFGTIGRIKQFFFLFFFLKYFHFTWLLQNYYFDIFWIFLFWNFSVSGFCYAKWGVSIFPGSILKESYKSKFVSCPKSPSLWLVRMS